MSVNLITIKEGKVIPDINILTIPELKTLYDKFEGEDRNLLFQYLHHLYETTSPYQKIPEDEREDRVIKDFKGNFKPKFDKDIIKAKEKLKELTYSPTKDLLEGARINIRNIATFLKTVQVEAGKDGNLANLTSLHRSIKDILKNYKATEQEFLMESAKNRGNSQTAIDEGEEY